MQATAKMLSSATMLSLGTQASFSEAQASLNPKIRDKHDQGGKLGSCLLAIWSFPSVFSLSDCSIWRFRRLFWPCDHSIWSICVHCPQILVSLRKNGQEESRLLNLRRSLFSGPVSP